jgi:pyruvate dehydrogenase E2 component (dihydrolipoamide acetyltransferase)
VRALARRHGINLDSIRGSGPAGRITRADVEAAGRSPLPRAAPVTRASQPAASRSLAGIAQAMQGTNERDAWGPTRREPLTRIRRTIAEAMVRSASTIPHVTDTDDADVTELDRLRKGYHSDEKPDRRLTLLPFAVRAVAMALKKYPILNASLDETAAGGEPTITHHDYISIAVGVQTERGLIAPVIREADRLSVVQIADALADLAGKARNASFEVNDTRGGTFTISNAGAMGGSRYSTPIINPPQSAVLALGRARWMAWVVGGPGGMIAPRLILPLSLSFDHRIIDGGVSVPFLQEIIAVLESPARLML